MFCINSTDGGFAGRQPSSWDVTLIDVFYFVDDVLIKCVRIKTFFEKYVKINILFPVHCVVLLSVN